MFEAFENVTAGLFERIKTAIGEVFDAVWAWVATEIFGNLDAVIPDWLGSIWSNTMMYLEAANVWFPVSEFILAYGCYLTLWGLFTSVKLVLKVIPTVG